jgi:hypothetical protein
MATLENLGHSNGNHAAPEPIRGAQGGPVLGPHNLGIERENPDDDSTIAGLSKHKRLVVG